MGSILMRAPLAIGVDFGTTNTVVALSDGSGPARLVTSPRLAARGTSKQRDQRTQREQYLGMVVILSHRSKL
jgi:molecular chaperone DnaK (HSP70)